MTRDHRRLLVICIALTLAAAPLRFIRLNALSFYGDEDLTALVATSVRRGDGPTMPSGMEYRRALPFTWMVAGSTTVFGEQQHWPYRLPSVILGTLTVPLLFLFGRWLLSEQAGITAALLLGLSAWHIEVSRQARMYSPFLFFYIAAVFALLAWARHGTTRHLILAALTVAATTVMHLTGVLSLVFAFLPLLFVGMARVKPLVVFGFAAAVAYATRFYERQFVGAPYRGWVLQPTTPPASPGAERFSIDRFNAEPLLFAAPLMVLGAALGCWVAARARSGQSVQTTKLGAIALFVSATIAGALAGAGQFYGFCLAAAVFLLIDTQPRGALVRRIALPGSLLLLAAAAGMARVLFETGSVRELLTFPVPYGALLALEVPYVFLVFAAMAAWLALRTPQPADFNLRIVVLGVLLPLGALGLSSHTPATRFAFGVYPFILLGAGAAVIAATQAAARWMKRGPAVALALAVLIVASGALGEHGVFPAARQTMLEHGESFKMRSWFYFPPDHGSAGRYVRQNRRPDDIVVAEDATAMHWYAGGVDYWLRWYGDAAAFLYQAPDGRVRDQYVNSAIVQHPALIDSVTARARGRVWLITSGETARSRAYFLDAEQNRWLDAVEQQRLPLFVARDSATRVYCLNCGPTRR